MLFVPRMYNVTRLTLVYTMFIVYGSLSIIPGNFTSGLMMPRRIMNTLGIQNNLCFFSFFLIFVYTDYALENGALLFLSIIVSNTNEPLQP